MNLPPDAIMKEMAKLAMEQAAEFFARMADDFAANPITNMATGPEALRLFANAIRATSSKIYPVEGKPT